MKTKRLAAIYTNDKKHANIQEPCLNPVLSMAPEENRMPVNIYRRQEEKPYTKTRVILT